MPRFLPVAVGIVDSAGGAEILTPGLHTSDIVNNFLETLKVLYLVCFNLHHIPSLKGLGETAGLNLAPKQLSLPLFELVCLEYFKIVLIVKGVRGLR